MEVNYTYNLLMLESFYKMYGHWDFFLVSESKLDSGLIYQNVELVHK